MALTNLDSQNIICELCSSVGKDKIALNCFHEFCRECLIKFWGSRVEKGRNICCPSANCKKIVGNYIFEEMLPKTILKKIDKIKCTGCSQKIIPLKFSCKHKFCPTCGSNKAKKILKKNELVFCFNENCNKTLNEFDLLNLGLSNKYLKIYALLKDSDKKQKNIKERDFSQMTTDLSQREVASLPICKLCSKASDSLFSLDCKHIFCQECLVERFKETIKEKQLIKCPEISCSKEVNYYLIKQILSTEDFIKYDESLLMGSLEKSMENEKKIQCPDQECNAVSLIWQDAQYFVCPQCKKKYCGNVECRGLWELHENKTCEEFLTERNGIFKEEEEEKNQEKNLEEKNTKICSVCNTKVKRYKNCNMIRCESLICQKKTVFCFLCEEILKKEDIDKHFVENNFYKKCAIKMKSSHYDEIMLPNPHIYEKNLPIQNKKKSFFNFLDCC